MLLRILPALLLAALAAGCVSKGPFEPRSTTMLWREVPDNRAVLTLGPALRPMVLAVSDRRGGQVLEQRYVLRNDTRGKGENALTLKITANGKAMRITSDEFLAAVSAPVGAVDVDAIQEGRNRYGSFLYVFGRPEGSPACLFALQRLQRSVGATLPEGVNQADITLRVCSSTGESDELLRLMSDWSIDPALGDPTAQLAAGG